MAGAPGQQPGDKSGGGPNIIGNLEDQVPDNENSTALLLPPYQAPGGLATPQHPPGGGNRTDEIMEPPAGGGRAVDRGRELIVPPV